MSLSVTRAVWERSRQSGTNLLIMVALADFANDDGIAWPSIPTLAQRVHASERQVRRIVRELIEAGEIVPAGTRHRGVVAYRIVPPTPDARDRGPDDRPLTPTTPVADDTLVMDDTPPLSCATGDPLSPVSPKQSIERPKNGQRALSHEATLFEGQDCQATPITDEDIAIERWNAFAKQHGLDEFQDPGPMIRRSIRARLREAGGLDGWDILIEKITESPGLRGLAPGYENFRVTPRWIIRKANFAKVMKGNYDGWGSTPSGRPGRETADQSRDRRRAGLAAALDAGMDTKPVGPGLAG